MVRQKLCVGTRALVTGGAGFIGSHLVDALLKRRIAVHVFDNVFGDARDNLKQHHDNRKFTYMYGDLLNKNCMLKAVKDCDIIFHFAADPQVRESSVNPNTHYQQNVTATFNLLEAVRRNGNVKKFVFASSSTVYGEASKIPTPEDYTPLEPISIYGATKLAAEALIIAYSHNYNFKTTIYRLVNIVGPRNKHGIILDFIQKLRKNPKKLDILGDGTQTKSYLYINDCIQAILTGIEKSNRQVETFNVGSEDQIDVKTIAQIVTKEMGLKNVKYKFTGGVEGGRGWKGDVKNMQLDISKLKAMGWKPKLNSKQAITQATRDLLKSKIYPSTRRND